MKQENKGVGMSNVIERLIENLLKKGYKVFIINESIKEERWK